MGSFFCQSIKIYRRVQKERGEVVSDFWKALWANLYSRIENKGSKIVTGDQKRTRETAIHRCLSWQSLAYKQRSQVRLLRCFEKANLGALNAKAAWNDGENPATKAILRASKISKKLTGNDIAAPRHVKIRLPQSAWQPKSR